LWCRSAAKEDVANRSSTAAIKLILCIALENSHRVVKNLSTVTVSMKLSGESNKQELGRIMQTATTFELTGFRITRSMGVVRGITVRTRSLPLSILGSLRTLFGGRAGIFSELCESAREESFQLMLSQARRLGANAVVGIRYDTGPMVGAAEVLCYGTAVVVEPL
jgi:uncharacterized protein YbjQ (UPF0145 family)